MGKDTMKKGASAASQVAAGETVKAGLKLREWPNTWMAMGVLTAPEMPVSIGKAAQTDYFMLGVVVVIVVLLIMVWAYRHAKKAEEDGKETTWPWELKKRS